jgi:hypothetical protein
MSGRAPELRPKSFRLRELPKPECASRISFEIDNAQ